MQPNLQQALQVFTRATEYVTGADLLTEVESQRKVSFNQFSETDLLREAAWVILCSGFRESVVRHAFDYISLCFCDWESAWAIIDADPNCCIAASASFKNTRKLAAIVGTAHHIGARGFGTFKAAVMIDPIAELQHLPYIGPITVWHLAKNLGLDVAKPDRHLTRLSRLFGFEDAHHFCAEVARVSGEERRVVDLVIWRYIADNPRAFAAIQSMGNATTYTS